MQSREQQQLDNLLGQQTKLSEQIAEIVRKEKVELQKQIRNLDNLIPPRNNRGPMNRKPMSAEQREAASKRMKAYHAAKKK